MKECVGGTGARRNDDQPGAARCQGMESAMWFLERGWWLDRLTLESSRACSGRSKFNVTHRDRWELYIV